MKKNSAFTLIELLVVIAIIGILSSVVLASVNTARAKGADAAIKSNLGNIRAQASIYYDANNASYGAAQATSSVAATCLAAGVFSDNTVKGMINAALSAAGAANPTCAIGAGAAESWAISVPLKSDATKSWCVSSSGNAAQINTTSALTIGNSCL